MTTLVARALALLSGRLGRFLLVGGSGVLVNSCALFILHQLVGLPVLAGSALAVELAIVNNYLLNDRWTFRSKQLSLLRFARFNTVSLGGLLLTTLILWVLSTRFGVHYLVANLVGIGLATAWNFAANIYWTWGGPGRGPWVIVHATHRIARGKLAAAMSSTES